MRWGGKLLHMKNHHAVALGKKGGQIGGRSRSPAKIATAKANGKKGGRPKKETEWWAQRTIEKLETELTAAKSERDLAITRVASILRSGAIDEHICGDVRKWVEDWSAELGDAKQEAAHYMSELDRLRAEVEKWQSVAATMSAEREHNANEASRLRAELERADVLYQRACEVEHALRAEVGAAGLARKELDSLADSAKRRNDPRRHRRRDKRNDMSTDDTNYRQDLTEKLTKNGETWADVESHTLTETQLDELFDHGYGCANGAAFTLWTKNNVYFPAVYDGAEWIAFVPRHPNGCATEHVGGG